jgi:glyoxylase I family protein
MQIKRCLHTALLVSDLALAEDFYTRILGLEKVDRSLKYPGAWYQVGDYQIHLIVDETIAKRIHNLEKWGRNSHIALAVSNIELITQKLLENGFEVQKSASGRPALFTQDLDGNVIELSEG